MKAELPDDDPEHEMTAEDACLFWGNVPDDVARFELQVASMRPQMAWRCRQDQEIAMKTIGGELPRYADYAERDNSTMARRDPHLDYEEEDLPADLRSCQGAEQPEYCPTSVPEGQVLSRSRDPRGRSQERPKEQEVAKPRKGWKWCKHCGYDGAKDWRDPSKPPVDTIPTEEGYILVQPKQGVNFLSDHASQDCPKYKAGAMYPCSMTELHSTTPTSARRTSAVGRRLPAHLLPGGQRSS